MIKNKERVFKNNVICPLMAIICCILWGSAFPCIKIGYSVFFIEQVDYWSQILFAGIRFFFAGILVIVFGCIEEKKMILPTKTSIKYIAILSIFQTIIQYVFFYIGLANVTGVNGSIINGAGGLIAIIIACIMRQEKFTSKKILGSLIGFIGVIIACFSQGKIGGFKITGEGFVLISALSYAISSICLKKFSIKESPVCLSGYQFILGGLVMVGIALCCGGKLTTISVEGVILLAYLSLLSAIAYTLWGQLLKFNPVSKVAVYSFMIPIAGSFLSAVFLNEWESINWILGVALLLVSVGIFIVNFNYHKKDNLKT